MRDPASVSAEMRMHGLSLAGAAMRDVCDFLQKQEDAGDALTQLITALLAKNLASSVVDVVTVRDAVSQLTAGSRAGGPTGAPDSGAPSNADGPLLLIDAFAVPRVLFDPVRRSFHSLGTPGRVLAPPESKVALYRERFHLVSQRLSRSKLFTRPALGAAAVGLAPGSFCDLTPLQALLGTSGAVHFVLGSLSLHDDGRYWLEDTTGAVAVDLANAATAAGFYTENCVVVAEGELRRDGIFEVRALGFPPAERREDSLAALNGLDMFGAGALRNNEVAALNAEAAACTDEMWVVMSDVFLDQPEVLDKLSRVLGAFESADTPPTLFVLMGDFCSTPFGPASPNLAGTRDAFERLADLLTGFPALLKASRFVLAPGPGDPGPAAALPRPPLLRSLVRPLQEVVPNLVLASNPFRVRWHAQEVVFFREDVAGKMRGACVRPPVDDGFGADDVASPGERLFSHLCTTLLQQSHLAPLPLPHAPVHWEWDHALWLYPLPHALVLADRSAPQASTVFEDTACLNPGSFGTDGSFAVYRPSTRTVELSAV